MINIKSQIIAERVDSLKELLRSETHRLEALVDHVKELKRHDLDAFATTLATEIKRIDEKIAEQKEGFTLVLNASDRAILKAEISADKRFDSVNEFRNTLADQQRTLMPRAESEAIFKSMKAEIDVNTKSIADKLNALTDVQIAFQATKTGVGVGWQYSIAVLGLITLVLGIIAGIFGLPHH